MEKEIKKTKSPALQRRLQVALASTRERKAQLQQTTAVPVKKTRLVKPKQLYVGLDRLLTDNRPLATPPRAKEDEEDPDNSYE
jgi:hypothetical protein